MNNNSVMYSTGTFAGVIDAEVRAYFNHAKEEQSADLYYKRLGLVDYEPDVPEEKLKDISGPGKGVLTVEGQQYGAVSKVEGYPVTLVLRKYTFDIAYTEEDVHWIKKQSSSKRQSTLQNAGSEAIQSLHQNINEDTAKVFYLGAGTTFLNCGNSEALYGSHTIKGDGSSQRNDFGTSDTHRALGSTAIVDAIAIMNRFKAHNGIQIKRCKNLRLLVAPEKIAEANKILYSLYGPNNANLGMQQASKDALSMRQMTIEAVEVPDITADYSDYWFLVETNRAKDRAFMAWAWKPRMETDNSNKSKGIVSLLGSTLFGPVVKGWQWTFYSKGDGSTPS